MSLPRFPLRAAAALFLERQQLDRPRSRRLTAASLAGFVGNAGGLQLDSINVLDRAHHLTLWSRFGPYDRAVLDRLVYRRRVLFEYWAHAACLVATGDFPAWRRAMLDFTRRSKGWGSWLTRHRLTLRKVSDAIRERGPLGNSDFEPPPGHRSSGWWNWKPASHALDYLWMTGVTTVHSRRHFQKRFDRIERVLPGPMASKPLDDAAFRRWHVERSLHAMGAATEADLRLYLTFPRTPSGWRREELRRLVRSGDVTPVVFEGSAARWFALTRDLPALERAARRRAGSRGATFLCPFDSFLWHRERVQALFGFDYKIEVYVPGPKRKFGYYVLPLLHDGSLIGRADFKTHRERGVLEMRALHFETWFAKGVAPPVAHWGKPDRDAALAGAAAAAWSLAKFVGASEVALGSVSPRALAPPMRAALAAARPDPRETPRAERPEPAMAGGAAGT